MKKLLLFLCCTIVLGSYNKSFAQAPQWSYYSTFPEGGRILDICVTNTNTIYALSDHSSMIFYSTDEGMNWTKLPGTQAYTNSTCIKYNNNTGTLYVGTSSDGVWWTNNQGVTWSQEFFYTSSTSGFHAYIATIGIDEATNTVLCFEPLFGSSRFYRTLNNGATWLTITNPSFGSALQLKYASNGSVYASTANGVFRSSNNGSTWTACNAGMPSLETTCIDEKVSAGYLFAGVDMNMATTDSSNTGVYRSSDWGITWAPCNIGLDCKIVKDIEVGNNGKIYASTINGVFESSDNATSWSRIDNGLQNTNIWKLAKDGIGNLFGGSMKAGVAVTPTGGAVSWVHRNKGIVWNYISDLHVDPSGKLFIMDGTLSGVHVKNTPTASFIRSDSGQRFTPVLTNAIGYSFDVATGARIVRSTTGSLFATFLHKKEMIFRSDDDGASWVNATNNIVLASTINYGSPLCIVFDTIGTVYVGINYSTSGSLRAEVFKSTNNGNSWTSIFQGTLATSTIMIQDLCIGPNGILKMTTNTFSGNDIKSYTGTGSTWTAIPTTGISTPINNLLLFVDKANTLYVRRNNNSLYRWSGSTWTPVIVPWTTGGKLFFDNNNNIYVTETVGNNIYYSNNAGASWSSIMVGVPLYNYFTSMVPVIISDLYFDQDNKVYGRTNPLDETNLAGIYKFDTIVGMPLDLLAFEGRKDGSDKINISWKVANEYAMKKHELQRSQIQTDDFITIYETPSQNQTGVKEYRYSDFAFERNEMLYYRLKMTDEDGNHKYSRVISINGENADQKLVLYPNPAIDKLTVELAGSSNNVTILVSDLQGRIMLKQQQSSNLISFDIHALETGIYSLQVIGESYTSNHTFIKQ